jgi:hypothetical protein
MIGRYPLLDREVAKHRTLGIDLAAHFLFSLEPRCLYDNYPPQSFKGFSTTC